MSSIELVKKRIIIGMIALVVLIITLFGITYAYFTAKVKGNENDNSVSVTAGALKLEYDDEDSSIVFEKIKPGTKLGTKVFSVTNTGTRLVENYDVVLENVVNELKHYEDLRYVLTCKVYETKDYKENKMNATEIGICDGNYGYFPKYDRTIISNSIDAGYTHYYEITVQYNETNKDQSADMNKKIEAKVNIEDNNYNMNNLIVYGNSIKNETTNEIESVGDKKNLFVLDKNKTNAANNSTFAFVDNGIEATGILKEGYPNSFQSGYVRLYSNKTLEPNTYTISWEQTALNYSIPSSQGINYYGYDSNGNKVYTQWSNTKYDNVNKRFYTTLNITVKIEYFYIEVVLFGTTSLVTNPRIEVTNITTSSLDNDAYEIPLIIRSKNLYNKEEYPLTSGIWIDYSNGTEGTSESLAATKNYIPCTDLRGKQITINHTSGENPGIAFYDASKTYIFGVKNGQKESITVTVPENASYFRFTVDKKYINEVQIEFGDKVTNYENYFEPITTSIYLNQPLRKVGDIADYIDFANSKVVRYIEVVNGETKVLEEPIEEPIELPSLKDISNNRIIEVNTSIKPSKIEY